MDNIPKRIAGEVHGRVPGVHRPETMGIFSGYEPLVCGDDAEAIELARHLGNGHDIELGV